MCRKAHVPVPFIAKFVLPSSSSSCTLYRLVHVPFIVKLMCPLPSSTVVIVTVMPVVVMGEAVLVLRCSF